MTKFGLDRVRIERKALTAQKMELRLPHLPPSTNHLYLNVPGRGRVKTRAYEDWIFQAALMLNRQKRLRDERKSIDAALNKAITERVK